MPTPEEEAHARCEKQKAYSLAHCPNVVFMIKMMKKAGCEFPPGGAKRFISCEPCHGAMTGGSSARVLEDGQRARAETANSGRARATSREPPRAV